MTRVALIPARGGSRRIPGKNIREFHGRPILAYSIETALQSGLFPHGVWVSTEDPAIARVAWQFGAKLHPRAKALAENDVGTQQVAAAALAELYPGEATRPAVACVIYATSPLMCVEDLKRGLEALAEGPTPYAYSVGPDGKDAGQFYWGLTSAFLAGVPLDHPRAKHVRLAPERTCDINTLDDWIRAERMYAALYSRCRSPSGACDQWTCTINGRCAREGARP